jgi:SNF2 family DNA or RNA helicase
MKQAADQQACIKGAECSAAVRNTNIVKVSSLGIEGELTSGRFGAKLQKMVDLIHSIPKRERVLVFLQWEDLAKKVSEALSAGSIRHETLTGSVKSRANTLDKFQQGDSDSARVLLLKMNDASAAGSNLTTANHAIFLGPLFTPSLLNYRAVETQAIGRIRRYGQGRKVHIHRLLALDTIDTTIFEGRTAELRVKPDHVEIPREEYEGKMSKRAAADQGDRSAKKAKRDEEPIEID